MVPEVSRIGVLGGWHAYYVFLLSSRQFNVQVYLDANVLYSKREIAIHDDDTCAFYSIICAMHHIYTLHNMCVQ